MTQKNRLETGENSSSVSFNRDFLNLLLYPACVINTKSVLEYSNNSFIQFFGEISQDSRFDWPKSFSNDHRKCVAQCFNRAINGDFSSCKVEIKTTENEDIPVEILMQPVSDNGNINCALIQIKVLNEDRNSNVQSGFRPDEPLNTGFFEYSPLPVLRFGKDFHVLKCSRSFEGILGFTCQEFSKEGGGISTLFKYDSERIKNQILEIFKGNIPFKRIGEIKARSKEGDEHIINIIIYPVARDNEIFAVDLIIEDITKLKELKEKLNSAKKFNLASDIGKEFIHSINETLNIVLNQVQLLQLITERNTSYGSLDQIEMSVQEVLEQLRRIMAFLKEKRDSNEEMEENFEVVLNDAIEFAKIHFKIEEGKKRRSIQIERSNGYETFVKTDTIFLRELIIWAILKVSAYAGKRGVIEVDLKKSSFVYFTAAINKQGGLDRDNIVPFTLDGFSPSEIREVAEKLSLKIIEEESAEQYSVKIIFPQKAIIDGYYLDNGRLDYKIEDKNIMIIENDFPMKIILGNLFERMGNRVFVTDNSNEAFEEFKRKNYEIVVIDYDCSGYSLIEFAARVKEINEDTITVLLSGLTLDLKGYTGFIDLYITKPFGIEEFIREVSGVNLLKVYY